MVKRATAKRRRRKATAVVLFDDIATEFLRDAHANRPNVAYLIAPGYDLDRLRRYFRRRAIAEITSASAREYALKREEQGAPLATINGELATLGLVLQFAADNGTLRSVPMVEFLPKPLPAWFMDGGPRPRGEPVSRGEPLPARRKRNSGPELTPQIATAFASKYRGSRTPGGRPRTLKQYADLLYEEHGVRVTGKYLNREVIRHTGQSLLT